MGSSSIFQRRAQEILNKANIKINGPGSSDVTVHDQSIYRDTFLRGTLGLGDGYATGKWDVPELDVFFAKILAVHDDGLPSIVNVLHSIRSGLINTQAGQRAFDVGQRHYDLGNDMYEYMLGESMGYSSGLYLKDSDDLTAAQFNKFDALCQKLQLKPGMKLLEIGSGWGTFARHAAKNYGAEVIGLTVSKEQKAYAEKICQGLKAKFLLVNYQDLDARYNNHFDRIVSIEMIEAVGKKNFRNYFQTIERTLKDDGLVGIQSILGAGVPDPFISTRIFPNGLVPSLELISKNISGLLRIKQWLSFGIDYDKTLMAWDKNFQKHWPEISKIKSSDGKLAYDEHFYRMWHYYLMCCAGSFRSGMNDVAQIILSKPNSSSVLK